MRSEAQAIIQAAHSMDTMDHDRTLMALRFLRFKLEQRYPPREAFATAGIQRAVVSLMRCPSPEISREAASCVGGYSYTAKLAWELVQAGFLDVFRELLMNKYGNASPGLFDAIMLALGNVVGDQDTRCARAVEDCGIPPLIADVIQAYAGLSSSNLRNALFVLGNIFMRTKSDDVLASLLPVIPTVVKFLYIISDRKIHMDSLWAIYYALCHTSSAEYPKVIAALCNSGFFPILLEMLCQDDFETQKVSLEILKRTLTGWDVYTRLADAGPPKLVGPDVIYASGGLPSAEAVLEPEIAIPFNEYVIVIIVRAATARPVTQRTIAMSILYNLSGIEAMAPILERYGAIAAALLGMTVMTERIAYYSSGVILRLANLVGYVLDISPELIQTLVKFLDSWEGQRNSSSCVMMGLRILDELLARGEQDDNPPELRDTYTLDEIYAGVVAGGGAPRQFPRETDEISNPVLMHLVGSGIRDIIERLKVASSDDVARYTDELDLRYGILNQRCGHYIAGYDSVNASDDTPGL